jgi:hypothetical protein
LNKYEKIYIIGCQRSGTTLLRLILDSHKKIFCFDESKSYEILSDNHKINNIELSDKKIIGFKIPRYTEQLDEGILSDYGMTTCKKFYNNEPLLFIVRNVYDVICSMMSLKTNKKNWLSEWGIPIIQFWIKNKNNFKNVFKEDLEIIENSKFTELSYGALYWKFKNLAYFSYLESNYPILKIQYENLVRNPEKELPKITNFLKVDIEKSLFNHHTISHTEVDEKGFSIGQTDSKLPISDFHVERYKQILSDEQIKEIDLISKDLMTKLYN